jgi:hypothetical protein
MQYSCNHYSNFESVGDFAIGLMKPHTANEQLHAGLFFRDEAGDLKVLHLAFHYDLQLSIPDTRYVWIDASLDDFSKKHLASVCIEVFENNPEGIPYSISREGAHLSEAGIFCADYPYSGLTCSTFVMEFLHSQGYHFINSETWLKTPEDKVWQTMIVQMLESHSDASSQYIDDQRKQLKRGVSRFTPEEVCAAAGYPQEDWPVGRFQVKSNAKVLKRYVKRHRHDEKH